MRFRITMSIVSQSSLLPMNYQSFVSAWIYKVLRQSDADFATFLHEQGYGDSPTKLYKLFCFSPLWFGKPVLLKSEKLFKIVQDNVDLIVSFDINDIASHFIQGVFKNQNFYLGNKEHGIDLKVNSVAIVKEPNFTTTMKYSLKSPWVVSYRPEGARHPTYLSPDDSMFYELAIKHISEKYNVTRQKEPESVIIKIATPHKRSGFVIKPGTPDESRIVGNLFDFELTASVDVHKMIWSAGVSEKSSNGFGWLEVCE